MFKKYKWSNWYDINTGAFSNYFYVLQARRRNDGKVEFRIDSGILALYERIENFKI
jgi:hypothetical protein